VIRLWRSKASPEQLLLSVTIDHSSCRLGGRSVLLPCRRTGVLDGSGQCFRPWAMPDYQRGACCFGCAIKISPKLCVLPCTAFVFSRERSEPAGPITACRTTTSLAQQEKRSLLNGTEEATIVLLVGYSRCRRRAVQFFFKIRLIGPDASVSRSTARLYSFAV
jgi:hypothetical protein